MIKKFSCLVLALGGVLSPVKVLQASDAVLQLPNGSLVNAELLEAYRDFSLARARLIQYRQAELPQHRLALSRTRQSLDLQRRILQRRQAEYQNLLGAGHFSPIRIDAEYNRVALQAVKDAAEDVRDQEIYLMRFACQTDEALQYEVLLAALRVRAAHSALGQ